MLGLALSAFFLAANSALEQAGPAQSPCLRAGEKSSVVFLGRFVPSADPKQDPSRDYRATGFLILVDGVNYLVTARHVPESLSAEFGSANALIAFMNDKKGKLTYASLTDWQKKTNLKWILSSTADIAIIPFPVGSDLDVRVLPEALFLSSDSIEELQDVFFVSYQPGLSQPDRITPIARSGMVSVKNADGSFYIDAFAFPGNSGSPVFLKPTPIGFQEGGLRLGDPNGCKVIGLVGEYLPFRDVAISEQTKRPRIIFEENTGLAKVWPIQAIRQVIASPEFQAQHTRVKAEKL